ncbi:fungal-specific transcription factor domain-containing protein [Nemania diffusa]|nr:fungal-specific transcription factor domain-containing protein [Nemania diffusa]
MFNTATGPAYGGSPSARTNSKNPGGVALGFGLSEVSRPSPSRPKRSQVTRACDWCRIHRIKCDHYRPCSNCQNRGAECSNSPSGEIQSLPHAFREIERLKRRVRELESEIEDERKRTRESSAMSQPSLYSRSAPDLPLTPPPTTTAHGFAAGGFQRGILVSTTKSLRKTWHGQSSLFFFINRMSDFITSALHQPFAELCVQPHSASKVFDSPTSPLDDIDTHSALPSNDDCSGSSDPMKNKGRLTATQEEYFLGLFWQSYHTSLAIFDETEFKQYYKSLWVESREERKPSALVDIVIAICMQYGMARNQGQTGTGHLSCSEDIDANDASIAGLWQYHQCQRLLSCEMESPTLSTLQCTILEVIWLSCASFQNMACNTLALAANMAHMLGLHLPAPHGMPRREMEMRKRLWWSIYVLDTKISMNLGRPFILHQFDIKCSLPSDEHEVAALSGSSFSTLSSQVTWLSWTIHHIRLVAVARSIYTAFYGSYTDLSDDENPQVREISATFLVEQMKSLDSWAKDLPDALKTRRKSDGSSLSTDRRPLDMEQFAPSWVQHQRLTLELLYHTLCVTLWRPYVLYELVYASATSEYGSTIAESCANNCANHAITLTHIMHQVLTTTDILAGWYEAFHWQWNCAITLVGFALTRVGEPLGREARNAIVTAIEVLEIFGKSFAAGVSAANVMRKLRATVDHVTTLFEKGRAAETEVHGLGSAMMLQTSQGNAVPCEYSSSTPFPELDEAALAALKELLSGSIDIDSTLDYADQGSMELIYWSNS